MIAYCGIDCSQCESFLATRSGSSEELARVAEKLSERYHADVRPEHVICDGCKADKRHSLFCSGLCKMRQCCIDRNYGSCIECAGFPCKELQFELEHSPEARDNLERLKL